MTVSAPRRRVERVYRCPTGMQPRGASLLANPSARSHRCRLPQRRAPDSTATHGRLGRLGGWAADHRRAGRHRLVRRRAGPGGARAVRGPGAVGRRVGGAALGVRGRSPRARVALPGPRQLRALRGRRRARADRRPARCAPRSQRVGRVLRSDPAVAGVLAPAGRRADRRTAIVVGLAGAPPDEMVEAAGRLKAPPRAAVGARASRSA